MKTVYPGFVASVVRRLINKEPGSWYAGVPMIADEHQGNGAYAVHQIRVRIPGDATEYRVIIAPADAPVAIGGVLADQHFAHPLGKMPTEEAA